MLLPSAINTRRKLESDMVPGLPAAGELFRGFMGVEKPLEGGFFGVVVLITDWNLSSFTCVPALLTESLGEQCTAWPPHC